MDFGKLAKQVEQLKKSKIKEIIDKRIQEFKNNKNFFNELCFCILTANFNAERSILIQKEIGNRFLTLSEKELANKLKELGHRFPNTRAKYIVENRKYANKLQDIVNYLNTREWLVNNIKGLGYKEASHFLRNIGFDDYAIVDFHILDLLNKYNVNITRPLTKSKYLGVENILRNLAVKLDLTLAELDLYLWYIETGKVLK